MAKQIIQFKLDVMKISKERLYKGKKGTYLSGTIFVNDEADEYGNNGMIVEAVSKEEKDAGIKGNILGNIKIQMPREIQTRAIEDAVVVNQDLPF